MSSSDSDSSIEGQTAVLPVASFTEYDSRVAPATGQEYLRRVQLQAGKCPKIAAVSQKELPVLQSDDRPYYLEACVSSSGTISDSAFRPCPPEHVLPLHAQQQLVQEFADLRSRIEKRRSCISDEEMSRMRSKFPAMNQYLYWKKYCMHSDSTSGSGSSGDELTERAKRKTNMTPARDSRPNLRLLLSLTQAEVIQLLSLVTKWVRNAGQVTERSGFWIFSLMACSQKPLPVHAFPLLRGLARTLSLIRSRCPDQENLKSCNLIICLIARYFEQFDLTDHPVPE